MAGFTVFAAVSDPHVALRPLCRKGSTHMANVIVSLAVSLDGFIAGPNAPDNPLRDGGMRLFDWYFDGDTPSRITMPRLSTVYRFHRSSCLEPALRCLTSCSRAMARRLPVGGPTTSRTGGVATVRHQDVPLFIGTDRAPPQVPSGTSRYTLVTDGVESASAQAKTVAGKQFVTLVGASVAQQCLRLGLLDEIQLHRVPVLLGGGVRLFDHLYGAVNLEHMRVVEAPAVTHLRFRVVRGTGVTRGM
jgi:RibD C-terminal domain